LNEELVKNGLHIFASLFAGVTPRNDELVCVSDGSERSLNAPTLEE
jgi:hypothetical protein